MNISDLHRRVSVAPLFSPNFIITVKTDNAGVSASNQFTLPTTGSNYDCVVEWGDGTSDSFIGDPNSPTHTYPSAGIYTITIKGVFPRIFFNNTGDRLKLIEIQNFGFYSSSDTVLGSFFGCSNMDITAGDLGDFSNTTNMSNFMRSTGITNFPKINTSNTTLFAESFHGCNLLSSFPSLDLSKCTSLNFTWNACTSLTEFPVIQLPTLNTINCTLNNTWRLCTGLTSFPLLDFSRVVSFVNTWGLCTNLQHFPPNAFDNCISSNFSGAFNSTNLTEESIDNILVSIDASGRINGTFGQSGGNAPSILIGRPAIDSLRAKGWTVTVTGGY